VFGWACLLFFLYGSLSDGNIIAIFFLLLGAIAIASANFLILELTHPYQGIFKVSSAPFDLLLESMIQEENLSGYA
jgi:membrane-bound ClpP family serine protease